MVKLELEFVGFKAIENYISIDGKILKPTSRKLDTLTYIIDTTKDTTEVVIHKSHNYIGNKWFWSNIFYFIISIFGLFDTKPNKNFLVQAYQINLTTTQDTKATISRQEFEDGGKLAKIETNSQVEEINNTQYYDKEAKIKHKKLKRFKLGIIFVTVATIVALIAII